MTLAIKERILCIALVIELVMHMDVWAWGRIQPIWLGAFPYHLLWGTLEVIAITSVFLWWGFYRWEDPTDALAHWKDTHTCMYPSCWNREAGDE